MEIVILMFAPVKRPGSSSGPYQPPGEVSSNTLAQMMSAFSAALLVEWSGIILVDI